MKYYVYANLIYEHQHCFEEFDTKDEAEKWIKDHLGEDFAGFRCFRGKEITVAPTEIVKSIKLQERGET